MRSSPPVGRRSPASRPFSAANDAGNFSAKLVERAQHLAFEEGANVLDRMRIEQAIVLLRHVSQMRREEEIVERRQRMAGGQRLRLEDVERGAGDAVFAQNGDERR